MPGGMPAGGLGGLPGAGQAGRGPGGGQGAKGNRGGPGSAPGAKPGDRDGLEKNQPANLIIEVLCVEVTSPEPVARRPEAEE